MGISNLWFIVTRKGTGFQGHQRLEKIPEVGRNPVTLVTTFAETLPGTGSLLKEQSIANHQKVFPCVDLAFQPLFMNLSFGNNSTTQMAFKCLRRDLFLPVPSLFQAKDLQFFKHDFLSPYILLPAPPPFFKKNIINLSESFTACRVQYALCRLRHKGKVRLSSSMFQKSYSY